MTTLAGAAIVLQALLAPLLAFRLAPPGRRVVALGLGVAVAAGLLFLPALDVNPGAPVIK